MSCNDRTRPEYARCNECGAFCGCAMDAATRATTQAARAHLAEKRLAEMTKHRDAWSAWADHVECAHWWLKKDENKRPDAVLDWETEGEG